MSLSEQICPQRARADLSRLLYVTTVAPTLRAFLLPYARHFRGLGWRVDALTGSLPISDADVRKAFDSVHTAMWMRNPLRTLTTLPSCCRQIRALVRENRYDIVHVHTPIASWITRFALRKERRERGTRVVYTAHGFHFYPLGRPLTNWLWRCLEKLAGRWTDALVVINREDFESAQQHRIVIERELHRLPGIGIDLDLWKRDHVNSRELADLRKTLNIKTDTPVLLCVGDLIPRKRHSDLLRGFAAFLAQQKDTNLPQVDSTEQKVGTPVPAVCGRLGEASLPRLCTDYYVIRPVLILAGDGPLRSRLEALSRNLGIEDCVRFVGFQSDMRPFYMLADATVLVSLQEGLPRSLMESLVMETPAIATDVRGNHELVDDSCGFLVPPRDTGALVVALQRLFALLPEQRRELGRRGRARMADYSIIRCLAMTKAVYASLR